MTTLRPIDLAVEIWKAKPSGDKGWYSAHCTGHEDTSASLGILEAEDGSVIFKCHAGCTREMVIARAHTTEKALRVKGSYRPKYTPRPKYDLFSLAHDKLLNWRFLFNEGVTDGYKWNGTDCVQIQYYDFNGEPYLKERVRIGPSGNKDSYWNKDTPGLLIPYGYQHLDLARQKGYMFLGEGESDGWTCWYHDIPYLGLPGATQTQCLDGNLLNDIPAIYVIQEPDKAGQGFYKSTHRRLRETGYTGQIFACPWKKLTGWKDPNELHRMIRIKDPNDTHAGFQTAIAATLDRAIPAGDDISLEVSEMNAQEWVPRSQYDELRDLYHELKERHDFILQVIAVPDEVLKASDKITNIVIDDELRSHAPNEKGFYPIRMTNVEKRTGLGYKTVLRSKKRLETSLGLYEQTKVTNYHVGPDGETSQRDSIFLRPQQKQKFPRLYTTDDPIKWGGQGNRQCPECGSKNIDVERVTICHDCHKISHNEIYTSQEPLYPQNSVVVTEYNEAKRANTEEQTGLGQLDPLDTNKILGQVDPTPHEKPEIHQISDTGGQVAIVNLQSEKEKRICSRCGRIGEIERNPDTNRLSCICYKEDFDTAHTGKLARITPAQREALM